MSLLSNRATASENLIPRICHQEDSQRWNSWQGPEWLLSGVNPCSEPQIPSAMPEECSLELKAKAARSTNLLATSAKCPISQLIDCKKFNSLTTLLRVTAQVLRAVEKFKAFRSHQPSPQQTITRDQIAVAVILWITNAQSSLTSAVQSV